MSNTVLSSLSVVGLLKELHQVTDWYMLGVYLELPSHELDKIRQQFLSEGVERCKAAMFNLWLRSTQKASWELIANGLECSGEKVLAEKIRRQHLAVSEFSFAPVKKLVVDVEETVVDRFTDLEDNFAILCSDIVLSLQAGK